MANSFETPWTVVRQAPLSMRFPWQECWSGLPFPIPGDLPDPEIQPAFPALSSGFFTTKSPRKPCCTVLYFFKVLNYKIKNALFFVCLFSMCYLCENYYKPIMVLSWEPRLTLLDLQIKLDLWTHSLNGIHSLCRGLTVLHKGSP